jgi:hypothetical protein
MTEDELNAAIEKAETQFSAIPGITPELINSLIENGCLSYEDLEPLTVQEVMQMTNVDEDMADEMIIFSAEQLEAAEKQGTGGGRRESSPPRLAPVVPTKAEQFDSLFKPTTDEVGAEGESVASEAVEDGQEVAMATDESMTEDQPGGEEVSDGHHEGSMQSHPDPAEDPTSGESNLT